MLERLSKDARIVLVLAEGEARSLRHDHVGTLHLLLALLGSQNTAAGQILAAAGLRLAATRGVVHGLVAAMPSERAHDSPYTPKKHRERRGRRPQHDDTPGPIPFNAGAKKALEKSMWEAIMLKHDVIVPEHVLLGLLRERDDLIHWVLTAAGCSEPMLRGQTFAALRPESDS